MAEEAPGEEELDICEEPVAPEVCFGTNETYRRLREEERQNPSQFISSWEFDENDVEEATEEEKQSDPVQRILWGAETANREILEEVLKVDPALVNACDQDGYTPLHRAAYEGHTHIIQFLLERGAQIENRTNDGWTSLHSAANWGHAGAAGMLLRHGADINAQTDGLHTPLHLAAVNSTNSEILELLLMNDFINFNLRNKVGETARDIANRSNRFHQMFEICDFSINSLFP